MKDSLDNGYKNSNDGAADSNISVEQELPPEQFNETELREG